MPGIETVDDVLKRRTRAAIPGLSAELSMNMQTSVSATTGQAWRDTKGWASATTFEVPPIRPCMSRRC